jgi:hypothetical protein
MSTNINFRDKWMRRWIDMNDHDIIREEEEEEEKE